MITYDALHEQNHRITELSNVLSHLLRKRNLCDTDTCCDLFYQYMDRVNEHMELVDTHLYGPLMNHQSRDVNDTAGRFMEGSRELKRIMGQYVKKWCDQRNHGIAIGDRYDEFLRETDEMFDLILNRIQRETERLYPLIRQVSGDQQHAA